MLAGVDGGHLPATLWSHGQILDHSDVGIVRGQRVGWGAIA